MWMGRLKVACPDGELGGIRNFCVCRPGEEMWASSTVYCFMYPTVNDLVVVQWAQN